MKPSLIIDVLSDQEIAAIHGAAVRILGKTGLMVDHEEIRRMFADHGAEVDEAEKRIRFPEPVIDRFISETQRIDYRYMEPRVSSEAGVYLGMYLDPETNDVVPFTEETLAGYIKLALALENVDGIHLLNLPIAAGSPTEPLELRLFCWKHGAQEAGSIQQTALCPHLLDMYRIRADSLNKPLEEVFCGGVFLISPLRFSAHEAQQMMYFYEHGLRVDVTNMITMGGSGPVTVAGCLALNLAERIFIGLLNRILYGDRSWVLEGMIAPIDMRTAIQPYGRPESLLANLAVLQLGRYYGVPASGHSGLTDAKVPSHEAGAQKLLTSLPCALAGGANIEPGLLAIDELFSPIQMILDAELTAAVRRSLTGFDVTEDTLAVDVIDEVGPGGFFTGTEHTVRYFRSEIWEPTVWAREMLGSWLNRGRTVDTDRALWLWREKMNGPNPESSLDEDTERRLREIVKKAR